MKNFKKLSRTDLKKVTGRGLACTYSYKTEMEIGQRFQANAGHGQVVNRLIVTLVSAVVHYV
ncbi:hypothetical protein ATB97_08535 [Elizabethkingia bruuniana]|uniref:bacteriocin-like protein n=1 Tax=Elizabethkingia bruuniana TaxID=1756149 RepID=UPI00052B6074|nr:hypothetical protein [Elizabethkingia bruuniana]AQX85349.1 hypothetical protein AYC65_10160 [Elizabethkingia bruuniana]KGO10491.1 hypothetical protein KS04_08445 [Elizabethkingia miricola]KUY25271.1 hypothetical protein ATB97_08535 [Elizabethkingia bruuniana]OPB70101.1 hypothetical protein BAY12_15625 [Elizabethkingia bruuniana]